MSDRVEQILPRQQFDVAHYLNGHKRLLDVGCGPAKWPGATGIDWLAYPGVDVVHNLEQLPWPLPAASFDAILSRDSLEHVSDVVGTMNEFHRLLAPNGRLVIVTPHVAHPSSFRDPTHKQHFTLGTFDYFTGDISYPRYTEQRYRMVAKGLTFPRALSIGRLLVAWSTSRYEKYYAHRWPPHQMFFVMDAVK